MVWSSLFRNKPKIFGSLGGGLLVATAIFAKDNNISNKKDNDNDTGNAREKKEKRDEMDMKPSDSVDSRFTSTSTSRQTQLLNVLKDQKTADFHSRFHESVAKARDLCQRVKDLNGLPGLVIGVSVNGRNVWSEGFGYADIENRVPMTSKGILRIASISKPMTMAMLGQLIEEGKIDVELPIQNYLPDYPKMTFEGKKVIITTRDLVTHLSGIRHYSKKGEEEKEKEMLKTKDKRDIDMSHKEFYLKDKFESVDKALELFKNDELFHKPGTKYMYSTHGWTVVSAIIEKIVDTPFDKYSKKMFTFWGLKHTYLDEHKPIIYNRTKYYSKDEDGHLINSPYVDNSYKWAGGGFLSSVSDLMQFANILLDSYQNGDQEGRKCPLGLPKSAFLKKKTMDMIWKGDPRAKQVSDNDFMYGMGFVIGESLRKCTFCKEWDFNTVFHTGGAMGASSVLLVTFPKKPKGYDEVDQNQKPKTIEINDNELYLIKNGDVEGVVVAMMTNLTDVSLARTAIEIANLFKWLSQEN